MSREIGLFLKRVSLFLKRVSRPLSKKEISLGIRYYLHPRTGDLCKAIISCRNSISHGNDLSLNLAIETLEKISELSKAYHFSYQDTCQSIEIFHSFERRSLDAVCCKSSDEERFGTKLTTQRMKRDRILRSPGKTFVGRDREFDILTNVLEHGKC